jgi:hypothetical protein
MNKFKLALFSVLIVAACSNDNIIKNQSCTYLKSDSAVYNFIVLFNRYVDADWCGIYKNEKYSANIIVTRSNDSLQMYFYPNPEGEIRMPISDSCRFCYFIDGHYIFATESLFSFPSLDIDSVYNSIDPSEYSKYKRREVLPPPSIWDIEPMRVRFVKNQYLDIKIGY